MGVETAVRPQHMEALERANEVREARRRVRDWIADGRTMRVGAERAAAVLRDPPTDVTLRIQEVLEWIPRVGKQYATKMIRAAGLKGTEALAPSNKALTAALHYSDTRPGILSERQREAMACRITGPPGNRLQRDPLLHVNGPVATKRHSVPCSGCENRAQIQAPWDALTTEITAAFRKAGRLGPDGPLCFRCSLKL